MQIYPNASKKVIYCTMHGYTLFTTSAILKFSQVMLVMAKIGDAASKCTSIDLSDLLSAFTCDIVCHVVSGKLFRKQGHDKLFHELIDANALLIGGFNLEDYFPMLVKLGIIKRMVCAKARKVNKMWDDLLNNLIDEHASKPTSEHDNEENDFIDVLLSIQHKYNLTRDHIKAQMAIMFEAGTDTSFIVLEYAMIRLVQNPHLMQKLQDQLRSSIPKGKEMVTEDDINNLAYLEAVIKETLRLHMPAPLLVPYLSMVDCNIKGYKIPSGTRTIINSWALASTTPRLSFGDTSICWNMVPLPTDNLPLTHMLTEDKIVGGLAVGKGIADRSSLADTFLVGIHPTYADR
ncbi:hypothetical protein VPH35_018326 [Triticum aestivum]